MFVSVARLCACVRSNSRYVCACVCVRACERVCRCCVLMYKSGCHCLDMSIMWYGCRCSVCDGRYWTQKGACKISSAASNIIE